MTLERELVALGEWLDTPSGAGLATRVGASVRVQRRRSTRRRLVVVLALLVVLVLVVSLVPAVGEWLGVRGVEVRQQPPPTSAPVGRSLDLGVPSTLADAARRAHFRPLVPSALGAPDGVWLDKRPLVPVVSLVYDRGPLVSEFRAGVAEPPVIRKFAGPGVRVTAVDVDGHAALWVEGTHVVAVEIPGEVFGDRLRLGDSALLLTIGDITVRVETRRGLDDAVRVARNLVASVGVEGP